MQPHEMRNKPAACGGFFYYTILKRAGEEAQSPALSFSDLSLSSILTIRSQTGIQVCEKYLSRSIRDLWKCIIIDNAA